MSSNQADVIIVGGGLAGLSLAILLSRRNYDVLVLEKDNYPRHKVCGEYISMESWPFLRRLGLPLDTMSLPKINKLVVTTVGGSELTAVLPQGGFGISRYKMDAALAELATGAGVRLLTNTRVEHVHWANEAFTVEAGKESYTAPVVCGTWGKRSKLDIKTKRPFITEKQRALTNYVGIKYHVSYPWPEDLIGLHNFADGYCGISRVEDERSCLCYLTTAPALQRCGNDIKRLEHEVLMKNPWLEKIFGSATILYDAPLAISQISFVKKEQVLDHILMLGDAAGVITPLCGNGMSMALHAASLADGLLDEFLKGGIERYTLEHEYEALWREQFSKRLAIGRMVQRNFGKDKTTAFFINAMKALPFVRKAIIRGAAGKPF